VKVGGAEIGWEEPMSWKGRQGARTRDSDASAGPDETGTRRGYKRVAAP